MPSHRRPVRRALLAVVSTLVATVAFTTTLTAVAVTPALADVPTSEPLLLIHGFNDDCAAAWAPAGTQKAVDYLASAGFTTIDEVGYYNSTERSTDPNDPGVCSEELNTLPAAWSTGNSGCDSLSPDTTAYGTKDEHIDRLACLLAWYIWNRYSQYGRPVNVLAHSMGGLIIRDAIGRTSAHAGSFPPQALWVPRVVTVATPHSGIGGLYRVAATQDNYTNGVELDDMQPGSAFMNMIGGFQKPQGAGGTYWALMGAADGPYWTAVVVGCTNLATIGYPVDGGNAVSCLTGEDGDAVVPLDSAMGMQADYKVAYGVKTCARINCVLSGLDVADTQTQYEHEVGIPCAVQIWVISLCFGNGPYYLNDAAAGNTSAFVCASGCNDTSVPGGDAVSVPHALAAIVSRLKISANPPGLSSTSLVIRSMANNDYASMELNYTGSTQYMLRARSTTLGSWESYTEYFLPNGGVAIKSNANGLFVTAETGYSGNDYGMLRARSTTIGPPETFDTSTNSDGTYSIRSRLNGRYVSAETGYTGATAGELRAAATTVAGTGQKFTQNTGAPGCTDYGGPTITGPNGCVGFHTQAPPGKPASGNVWFSSKPYGYKGQELWTYANGTVATSTAVYQLSGLDTVRVMTLQAWVPDHTSDATHAHYHYCSPGGGCADGYVNQAANTNVWVTFGAVCTTDGTATVTLADDGGDTYPRVVGADAVRAVRLSGLLC